MKRHKTTYSGVFYREAEPLSGNNLKFIDYIVFKQGGKVFEEKVGPQYADDMTPARAARIRRERIVDRRIPGKRFGKRRRKSSGLLTDYGIIAVLLNVGRRGVPKLIPNAASCRALVRKYYPAGPSASSRRLLYLQITP